MVHGPQRPAPRLQLTVSETLPESPASSAAMHSNGGFRGFDLIRQPQELNSNDTNKGSEQSAPGIACKHLTPLALFDHATSPWLSATSSCYQDASVTVMRLGSTSWCKCVLHLCGMWHERLEQVFWMPHSPCYLLTHVGLSCHVMSACHACHICSCT